MVSAKTIFAYILYAIVATALFLIVLFPDQAVKAYVNGRLAAIDPLLSMDAAAVRPALPPGLKMVAVDLHHDRLYLAHFDNARMSPVLGSLLKDEKHIRFHARLGDGDISGTAVMAASSPSGMLRAEADLARIRLDQLEAIKTIEGIGISGLLSGQLTHDGGRLPVGATNGKFNLAGLRLSLKEPVYGIAEVIVDQADTAFSFNGRNLRLQTFTFGGPMVEGRVNGTIELRTPFGKSRLNLSANVKPQPELFARLQEIIPQGLVNMRTLGTRGVSLRLRGTVDNPKVSMR